jgi:hypothetical protein
MTEKKRTGPPTFFSPKDPKPVTLNLTSHGKKRLDEISTLTGASRADVVEWLIRTYGHAVTFIIECRTT